VPRQLRDAPLPPDPYTPDFCTIRDPVGISDIADRTPYDSQTVQGWAMAPLPDDEQDTPARRRRRRNARINYAWPQERRTVSGVRIWSWPDDILPVLLEHGKGVLAGWLDPEVASRYPHYARQLAAQLQTAPDRQAG
jgi:hypothetical protein